MTTREALELLKRDQVLAREGIASLQLARGDDVTAFVFALSALLPLEAELVTWFVASWSAAVYDWWLLCRLLASIGRIGEDLVHVKLYATPPRAEVTIKAIVDLEEISATARIQRHGIAGNYLERVDVAFDGTTLSAEGNPREPEAVAALQALYGAIMKARATRAPYYGEER